MNALERMRDWLEGYEGFGALTDVQIDYAERRPGSGGIFPAGLEEVGRKTDLLGNVTVTNRYRFTLRCVFAKAPGDDAGAAENAGWVVSLQDWIQQQSAAGLAPAFGDDPKRERVLAQNGALREASDEGTAVYTVELAVQFVRVFR